MADPNGLSPEQHYQKGLRLLQQGAHPDAYDHLSRAYLAAPQEATYRSAYALGLALIRGQFLGAVELARGAVREEFYNPDLYLNLAKIYEAFGFKAEAIRYLKRGLMVDPEAEELRCMLDRFGVRRRPPLRFLPREHLANRLLGRLHARLAAAIDRVPSTGPAPAA